MLWCLCVQWMHRARLELGTRKPPYLVHPQDAFRAVNGALQRYGKDRELDPLVSTVLGSMRAARHRDLLSQFSAFLPPQSRPEFLSKVRCGGSGEGARTRVLWLRLGFASSPGQLPPSAGSFPCKTAWKRRLRYPRPTESGARSTGWSTCLARLQLLKPRRLPGGRGWSCLGRAPCQEHPRRALSRPWPRLRLAKRARFRLEADLRASPCLHLLTFACLPPGAVPKPPPSRRPAQLPGTWRPTTARAPRRSSPAPRRKPARPRRSR